MGKSQHYIEVRKLSPLALFSRYFMYVDVPDYEADYLFIQNEVRVYYSKQFQLPGDDYVVISCRVWKKDAKRFLEALEKLPQKMAVKGYSNYPGNTGVLFGMIIDDELNGGKRGIRTLNKQKQNDGEEVSAPPENSKGEC